MKDVSRQLDSLIDAIADGLRTAGLKVRLEDLESRKERLEQEITAAPPPMPRLHPKLAEIYHCKVENLHEALAVPYIIPVQSDPNLRRQLSSSCTPTDGSIVPGFFPVHYFCSISGISYISETLGQLFSHTRLMA